MSRHTTDMKDVFEMVQSHHDLMSEMHCDFMNMLKHYMGRAEGDPEEIGEKEVDDEESEELPTAVSESEGNEFDENGDPLLESYSEDDIDLEDRSFAYGKHLGLPISLTINLSPRGPIGHLIPIEQDNDGEEYDL